ncbi:MAG: biopolymer transporter ExbD [Deltaproteobacteria bacterium]|nr:biopolymer transporter ExbD [Deltaproteobacteria bacterium]
MKITRKYSSKARIEMIPLIDVVFLLLVTFIFFAMSMTIHKGIPVDLPGAGTARVDKSEFSEITVNRGGIIFLNGEEASIPVLLTRLTKLRQGSPDIRIMISGDSGSSYENIISVLDVVRKAGISGVSLETKWE